MRKSLLAGAAVVLVAVAAPALSQPPADAPQPPAADAPPAPADAPQSPAADAAQAPDADVPPAQPARVAAPPPARMEGATDVAAATDTRGRLTPGQSIGGTLSPDGDTDWYRIRLRAGRTYRFTLEGGGDPALSDPYLNLIGPQGGGPIASNDDSGGSLNSALSFTPTQSGSYFLEARGFSDDASGGYVLAASRGETPTPATPLTLGQSVTGTLSADGERDIYTLTLTGGQTYRLSLSGSGDPKLSDPFLSVANARGGDPLASDDDSGGDLNSYLEFTAPTTGEYFIEARAFNDAGTGGYTLTARAGDIPADATSDVSLSADGGARADRLHPAGDSDWFRVELTQGQTVRIRLNGGGGPDPALADPMLVVHGADGAELARDDDSGDGLNSYLEFTAAQAGAYFLEARGFQDNAQGAYTLSVLPGEIPATTDSDEMLAPDDPRTSTIGAAGDVDWFKVSMIEGRAYRFNLEGGAGAGELADPVLALFASDGVQITSDDNGGTGSNAYVTFIAPKSGDYFAAVSAAGGAATGRYTLRLADAEVPSDRNTDELLQGADDSRTSRIDFPNDQDAYRVAVEPGRTYRVTATGVNPGRLVDPHLMVQAVGGREIARDADSGPGLNAALTFTAPDGARTVLVIVGGAHDSTGAYTLSVRRQ